MFKPGFILLFVLNLLCFASFNESSFAQTLKVTGKVVDIRDQSTGVAGIRVRISRDRILIGISKPTDVSGNYSVEFRAGATIEVAYGNSQWIADPITSLSGTTNHSITKALVKAARTASFNATEAKELLTAAEYFKQHPEQYATELAQVNTIAPSLFPEEFRESLVNQREGMFVARLQQRLDEMDTHITEVEQNTERLSDQLTDLANISNTARGGSKAAQQTADDAVAGVAATNDRISALDDYVLEKTLTVAFDPGHAELSTETKAHLDAFAKSVIQRKGYILEISGFTDSSGSAEKNQELSQQRAENVARYLLITNRIPSWRITLPLGYGGERGIADNSTELGRARNNRVEIRLLINKALGQPVPQMNLPNM